MSTTPSPSSDRPALREGEWEEFVRAHRDVLGAPGASGGGGPRRWTVAAAAASVLVAAGAVVWGMGSQDSGGAPERNTAAATVSPAGGQPSGAPGAGVPSVGAVLPSEAPTALASLLKRPIITGDRAFPDETVELPSGAVYHRLDVLTTTDCSRATSPELAALMEQGEGCARLSAAFYTDTDRDVYVTVTVASFERAEDAGTVMGMAAVDPVTYQVVSLAPPPGSDLPEVPAGSPGVFDRLMTVRSVVFANAQWSDGRETGESDLTRANVDLLKYVNGRVVAYEQGRAVREVQPATGAMSS
ncbi:hypothetical protein [Streptomyces sp. URMC 125]|uniref:hypothetical protein n=1 Tax=Streptomyces sp. URMC 125 TaxID=3423419 RepID=UPI003F1D8BD9